MKAKRPITARNKKSLNVWICITIMFGMCLDEKGMDAKLSMLVSMNDEWVYHASE